MPISNSNVYTGKEAKDRLIAGVNCVADAVKTTLGARGSNAILQEEVYPFHIITNDGISIAQKVQMLHPVEQIGANIMKEVADRANKESGDGTTTAITLTQAILKAGNEEGSHRMEVKRSLDACMPIIEKSIDAQKRVITVDEVAAVATVSAEDPALGQMLQEIYQAIGKDGIVELDNSGSFTTSWNLIEGVRLRNATYISPYMATEGTKAVYKNPHILITKQRIATLADIDPLFQELSSKGINELVMFVDDIDPTVVQALAFTHSRGIFKTLIIKAPVLWKDWLYADFAAITGATIVEPASGVTLKDVRVSHLGTCDKIVTNKEETIVVGIKDISEHIKKLEEDPSEETQLRLAWLKTKAAVLKLGASSESELSYKRLKAEDARNAAYLALQDGVVPGGGVALYNAALELPETIGGKILREALMAPFWQIVTNAGLEPDQLTYTHDIGGNYGFDANTGSIVDMWEAKIVDPARVTKNSVRNAISIAGTVLTAETITVIPK